MSKSKGNCETNSINQSMFEKNYLNGEDEPSTMKTGFNANDALSLHIAPDHALR